MRSIFKVIKPRFEKRDLVATLVRSHMLKKKRCRANDEVQWRVNKKVHQVPKLKATYRDSWIWQEYEYGYITSQDFGIILLWLCSQGAKCKKKHRVKKFLLSFFSLCFFKVSSIFTQRDFIWPVAFFTTEQHSKCHVSHIVMDLDWLSVCLWKPSDRPACDGVWHYCFPSCVAELGQ